MLLRRSDGALVVGEHVSGVVSSVDIHLLTLNGTRVVQDRRYTVGQVLSDNGHGWIDQMAWLPDGRLAFTQRGQFRPSSSVSSAPACRGSSAGR